MIIKQHLIVLYVKIVHFVNKENYKIVIINCINIIFRSINKTSGAFVCNNCGSKGSLYDFKQALGDIKNIEQGVYVQNKFISVSPEDITKYQYQLFNKEDFKPVLDYVCNEIKINEDSLKKYSIGACNGIFYEGNEKKKEKCLVFPYLDFGIIFFIKTLIEIHLLDKWD